MKWVRKVDREGKEERENSDKKKRGCTRVEKEGQVVGWRKGKKKKRQSKGIKEAAKG